MKKITIYICDKCGEEFRKRSFCERHEVTCKAQNCEQCKHGVKTEWGYFCLLLMQDIYQDCKFELKEESKC